MFGRKLFTSCILFLYIKKLFLICVSVIKTVIMTRKFIIDDRLTNKKNI